MDPKHISTSNNLIYTSEMLIFAPYRVCFIKFDGNLYSSEKKCLAP